MHENPLLPNARLQEMYALMQRCRALAQSTRPAQPRLEAIFAACTLHLEPGDFCSPLPGSKVSETLAADRLAEDALALRTPAPIRNRMTLAAGAALALKLAGASRLALAYSHAGPSSKTTDADWSEALIYATQAALPLIHLVAAPNPPSSRPSASTLSWASVSALSRRLKLPVLTVDGADAVAVYRVMQESAHRARQGDGAAVIWCVLPPSSDKSSAADPLRKMQRYLADRNLLPSVGHRKRGRP